MPESRVPMLLRPGEPWRLEFIWDDNQGSFLWSPGIAIVKNQVVTSFPNDERYFRAKTNGTTGPTQPEWNTDEGDETTDNSVTWATQLDSSYLVDLTGCTPHAQLRGTPDENPATTPRLNLTLDNGGIELDVATSTIAIIVTQTKIAALLAAGYKYGFWDLRVLFSDGVTVRHPIGGPQEFDYTATRS